MDPSLLDRLSKVKTAPCTCDSLLKDYKMHDSMCNYRLFTEVTYALIECEKEANKKCTSS